MPGYAHRVQNIGARYFEYDAAGNIIVEQDGKIDLEDSSKYYKIEEIDENKYIADSAWGYYTDEDRENKKSKVYRRKQADFRNDRPTRKCFCPGNRQPRKHSACCKKRQRRKPSYKSNI